VRLRSGPGLERLSSFVTSELARQLLYLGEQDEPDVLELYRVSLLPGPETRPR